MNKLPPARTSDIVVQDLGKEILVYDLTINKAFCLNETTSIVFRHCDNKSNINDVKLFLKDSSDEVIFLALDLLKENNLLQNPDYKTPFAEHSRRQLIKKIGLASLVVLPMISTVIAPTSAMAASGAVTCTEKLPTGGYTGWHCNFGPAFPGSAQFCNDITCNYSYVGQNCCSGSAYSVLDPSEGVNFYKCVCK